MVQARSDLRWMVKLSHFFWVVQWGKPICNYEHIKVGNILDTIFRW